MALYLISYDIAEKNAENYEPLWDLLKQWNAEKVLYSEWVVDTDTGMAETIAHTHSSALE